MSDYDFPGAGAIVVVATNTRGTYPKWVQRLAADLLDAHTRIKKLEAVAAWAAEYRRISLSGSDVTASVWYQLTTALDALDPPV